MVYFVFPVAPLFLKGVDQHFLFGQALFQRKDVVRRGIDHRLPGLFFNNQDKGSDNMLRDVSNHFGCRQWIPSISIAS
ncbi:hypothetical protein KNC47_003796 [Salmonella enterica]|nr:hypothetical protein [Salmonella enterica]